MHRFGHRTRWSARSRRVCGDPRDRGAGSRGGRGARVRVPTQRCAGAGPRVAQPEMEFAEMCGARGPGDGPLCRHRPRQVQHGRRCSGSSDDGRHPLPRSGAPVRATGADGCACRARPQPRPPTRRRQRAGPRRGHRRSTDRVVGPRLLLLRRHEEHDHRRGWDGDHIGPSPRRSDARAAQPGDAEPIPVRRGRPQPADDPSPPRSDSPTSRRRRCCRCPSTRSWTSRTSIGLPRRSPDCSADLRRSGRCNHGGWRRRRIVRVDGFDVDVRRSASP